MWVETDTVDLVFQAGRAGHEFSHILWNLSTLAPECVRASVRRTSYDNDTEREAEMMGSLILARAGDGSTIAPRGAGVPPEAAAVLARLSRPASSASHLRPCTSSCSAESSRSALAMLHDPSPEPGCCGHRWRLWRPLRCSSWTPCAPHLEDASHTPGLAGVAKHALALALVAAGGVRALLAGSPGRVDGLVSALDGRHLRYEARRSDPAQHALPPPLR